MASAKTIKQREKCLTNFDIYPLDVSGCFSNVDLIFILWIWDDGEDLGGKFDRVALGVLRFGGLAGCLV